MEEWQKRYLVDPYLHRLAILYHLNELYWKQQKHVADDVCPFNVDDFMKELADMYILLDMYKEFVPSFANLVEQRKKRFAEKFEGEAIQVLKRLEESSS